MVRLLGGLVLGFLATTAVADNEQKREIRLKAYDIIDAVTESEASPGALDEVIAHLDQALNLLAEQSNDGLFCEPRNSYSSYVTRIQDGTRVSDVGVSNDTCRQVIQKAAGGLVCAPRNSYSGYLTNVDTLERYGDTDVSYEDCYRLIQSSTPRLLCGPRNSYSSHVVRRSDGGRLGQTDVSNDRCVEILQKSTRTMVCAPRNSYSAFITRIDDGESIGADLPYVDCYERIRQLP